MRADLTAPADERTSRRSSLSSATLALVILLVGSGILEFLPALNIVVRPPKFSVKPTTYYALAPGDAVAVPPLISVKGHPAIRSHGQLFLTDVRVQIVPHLLEQLYWNARPGVDLQPARDVSGGLSPSEYSRVTSQMMTTSIRDAEVAAIRATGKYAVQYSKFGPKIVYVVPRTPAASVLRAGDVVEAVNGRRTARATSVRPLVQGLKVGEKLSLRIRRGNRTRSLVTRTVASRGGAPAQGGKKSLIGIYLEDQVVLPVKISVSPGQISGPSAGLLFALGIIQRLEGRDITHGCSVAGTGTIDVAGNVGAIGGAKQKVIAAREAGARYFLVPDVPDNVNPARANADGITVKPVKTLRQALAFLKNLKPCA